MKALYPRWLCVLGLLLIGFSIQASAGGTPASLKTVTPVVSCSSLTGYDLSSIAGDGSRITSAKSTTSGGLPVCQVQGTLAPQSHFTLLLPTKSWQQRYVQVGCGGLCGQISLTSGASDSCKLLNNGNLAMAATDMGHSGGMQDSGSWGKNQQQRQDFAYRAQHLTALASKQIIAHFYGQPQRYAYFNGCSDGGREALMEAMRYPHDFNGVIAGAPAMLFQVQNTLFHGWQADANTNSNGHAILTADRLPLLHKAVLKQCDALDGARDGLISAPGKCNFDPASIQCKAGQSDTRQCLTAAEVNVVRKFYTGPRDPKTGEHLTAGQPLYGSELNWAGVYVPEHKTDSLMSTSIAEPVLRYLAFSHADGSRTTQGLPFNTTTLDALRGRHHLLDATNTDLTAFKQAGGKLIMWHGLADPQISPANTVSLQRALVDHMGKGAVESFERLYLLPGVAHCGNGQGPSSLDLLTPMMAWVEQHQAPNAIMTKTTSKSTSFGTTSLVNAKASGSGKPGKGKPPIAMPDISGPAQKMSRPVYPYPYVAHYTGKGNLYDAVNWKASRMTDQVRLYHWPGSNLFTDYKFSD